MDDPTPARTQSRLHTAPRTNVSRNQGAFRAHFNFPGRAVPDHDDHGYGPLATVVESFMDPGTLIPMHGHRNEEIVSWVPAGVMRHDDPQGNDLVTDPNHLLVMNAGSGIRHAEETYEDDPPLRMLQIFVRPHTLDLEPGIQHAPIPDPVPNAWRHLFGPVGGDAPLFVRNAIDLYDCRLEAGATTTVPGTADRGRPDDRVGDRADNRAGDRDHDRHTYLYVFDGAVTVSERDGTDTRPVELGYTESAMITGDGSASITATEDAVLVAFRIDPDAPVTRQGTIGR